MIFLFFYLEISSRLNGETGRDLDDPATHVTPNPWQGQQLSAASRQFGKIQLTVEEYGDIRSQFCDRIERQKLNSITICDEFAKASRSNLSPLRLHRRGRRATRLALLASRSQNVSASGPKKHLRSQFVTSKSRGGTRYRPYAFTEHGISHRELRERSFSTAAHALEIAFFQAGDFHQRTEQTGF